MPPALLNRYRGFFSSHRCSEDYILILFIHRRLVYGIFCGCMLSTINSSPLHRTHLFDYRYQHLIRWPVHRAAHARVRTYMDPLSIFRMVEYCHNWAWQSFNINSARITFDSRQWQPVDARMKIPSAQAKKKNIVKATKRMNDQTAVRGRAKKYSPLIFEFCCDFKTEIEIERGENKKTAPATTQKTTQHEIWSRSPVINLA